MKKLFPIIILLMAMRVYSQNPPPIAAYQWNGTNWTAALSTATGSPATTNPPPAALYCFNVALGQWVPADSTCFGGGGGSGTVTLFAAPSVNWPSWLTPTVTNPTTTPLLAVAASAIPNSALANPATTVNGQTCTLGSTCTIPASGVSSFTGDGTILSNSASTGAVTATLANTPTGTGGVVLANSPTLVSPALGTPVSGVATNLTGAPAFALTNMTGTLTSPTLVTPALGTPASGVITNLTGTCTTCVSNSATLDAPIASPTFTGTVTEPIVSVTGNGAASVSPMLMSGTILTGGTSTTNFPQFLIQPTGTTAVTTWSTNGTALGINVPSGFNGAAFDVHPNGGASVFSVLGTSGTVTFSGNMTNGSTWKTITTGSGLMEGTNGFLYTFSSTSAASGTADTGIDRSAAGVLEVNLGTAAGSGGSLKAQKILSSTNCANSASPAVCGSASAGSVAIPTGVNPTLVVNTTAVTAASQILLTVDDTVTIGGTTCNSTLATLVGGMAVTARTASTSFTISYNGTITTNPLCLSYSIIN